MNVYALSVGTLTALLTIKLFKRSGAPNILAWYAWFLATFPLYYWIFALYGAGFIFTRGDRQTIVNLYEH